MIEPQNPARKRAAEALRSARQEVQELFPPAEWGRPSIRYLNQLARAIATWHLLNPQDRPWPGGDV